MLTRLSKWPCVETKDLVFLWNLLLYLLLKGCLSHLELVFQRLELLHWVNFWTAGVTRLRSLALRTWRITRQRLSRFQVKRSHDALAQISLANLSKEGRSDLGPLVRRNLALVSWHKEWSIGDVERDVTHIWSIPTVPVNSWNAKHIIVTVSLPCTLIRTSHSKIVC